MNYKIRIPLSNILAITNPPENSVWRIYFGMELIELTNINIWIDGDRQEAVIEG